MEISHRLHLLKPELVGPAGLEQCQLSASVAAKQRQFCPIRSVASAEPKQLKGGAMRLQESTEWKPKNGGMTKHDGEIANLLRLGGRMIPASLAARSRAAMKSMLLRKPNVEIEQEKFSNL